MKETIPREDIPIKTSIFQIITSKSTIEDFEHAIKQYLKTEKIALTSSASAGLYLLLNKIKTAEKNEVIIPAYTYSGIIHAIKSCGLKPILVDLEERSKQMSVKEIENKISKKTLAIIATHLYGQACDIKKIVQIGKKVIVIEDCAHALGSELENKKLGNFGDFAIYSFAPLKLINWFGGGAITGKSKIVDEIKKESKSYPKYNFIKKIITTTNIRIFTVKTIFWFMLPIIKLFNNFNIDIIELMFPDKLTKDYRKKFCETQAKMGILQLKHIDNLIKERREKAMCIINNTKNLIYSKQIKNSRPNYFLFPIICKNKKIFREYLLKNNIDTTGRYFTTLTEDLEDFPITRIMDKNALYLPLHGNTKYLVEKIKAYKHN